MARTIQRPKVITVGDLVDCQRIEMTEAIPTLWGAVERLSERVRELATLRH